MIASCQICNSTQYSTHLIERIPSWGSHTRIVPTCFIRNLKHTNWSSDWGKCENETNHFGLVTSKVGTFGVGTEFLAFSKSALRSRGVEGLMYHSKVVCESKRSVPPSGEISGVSATSVTFIFFCWGLLMGVCPGVPAGAESTWDTVATPGATIPGPHHWICWLAGNYVSPANLDTAIQFSRYSIYISSVWPPIWRSDPLFQHITSHHL